MRGLPDEVLDQPPLTPLRNCTTKYGVLAWCSQHEMRHAGQIGLLRRFLGHGKFY
ncbi:DinB family protein [Tautonia sociabilis]|uniref:DinB family protein n=1 Tax=Tautonia sociabilis TaxID=2080755 RepID=UPI0011D05101|nr:DinB family protein [Tautonia sociabilis]